MLHVKGQEKDDKKRIKGPGDTTKRVKISKKEYMNNSKSERKTRAEKQSKKK